MDTPPQIIVALIGAVVSIFLAIWGLATAYRAKARVLAAEEAAKRGELVRVKALEAVDALLVATAALISVVGTLAFLVRNLRGQPDPKNEEVAKTYREFGERRASVATLRIRYAPFLTNDVLDQMDEIFARTEYLEMNPVILDDIANRLRKIAASVAVSTRTRFLS